MFIKQKNRIVIFVESIKLFRQKAVRFLVLTLVAGAVIACQKTAESKRTPSQTLILATSRDAGTFDPAVIVPQEWTPLSQIYETLVEWDFRNNRLTPKLAVEWKRTDDLTWIFNLRRNVKFHDGTDLDAEAAKFSLERFLQIRKNWQGLNLESIAAIDSHVLQIKTREPFAALPDYLAYLNAAMVSPSAVRQFGADFANNPIGTGAFKLTAYRPQQDSELSRFEDYWGEKPLLEKVIFRYLPDVQTQILALETGEIDACRNIHSAEIERFRRTVNFTVQTGAGRHTHHLVFNRKQSRFRAEFDDARFRRAFNLAINRRELVELTLNGIGKPAASAVPPWFGLPETELETAFDLEKSRRLFAETGWTDSNNDGILDKNGRNLELKFVYSPTWYPQNAAMAEVLQYQLKKVGVELVLQPLEWGAAQTAERSGVADLRHRGITFAVGGVQYGLWSAYHSTNGAFKSVHFNNPQVDDLLVKAKTAPDAKNASKHLADVGAILQTEFPDVPLYFDEEVIVQNKRVAGNLLQTHPAIYPLDLKGIYIKE
jgi:peptide/nickel transport system substrate-binding protein